MHLGVNVDHVATVRQARGGREPDPVMAATLALLGGADGITVHLREDRRHIQDRDLRMLREVVDVELNLEMAATEEMTLIALGAKPDMVTLVPEKRQELTTEGGLRLDGDRESLRESILRLREGGIPVSLFIGPDEADAERARDLGADMVEIHTGFYANSSGAARDLACVKVAKAITRARSLGLFANAGHGLNYVNVGAVASIDGLRGLYIGHSIISRALFVGIENAVRQMKEIIKSAR